MNAILLALGIIAFPICVSWGVIRFLSQLAEARTIRFRSDRRLAQDVWRDPDILKGSAIYCVVIWTMVAVIVAPLNIPLKIGMGVIAIALFGLASMLLFTGVRRVWSRIEGHRSN